MSDYDDYVSEKANIDAMVSQGYVLSAVIEDLSGDRLIFEQPGGIGEKVSLLVCHANARKYWAQLLLMNN
ncbi:hypothetical protein ACFPYJ_24490 [Paenibacillus solisilvae]|uniref:Uncharacterized protein n=1 Tax=Paenibacillus solisilvae TaxID=2486751 RepID=A0ABW0W4M6_9BACL